MNWKIITVGKPALAWARDAVSDYHQRLGRTNKVELVYLKPDAPKQIEKQMLAASESSLRIVLDERGKAMRSRDLAGWIQRHELAGSKRCSLMIGGADGHGESLRQSADECWSLSSFTLQHELALVVVLEQLYRAYSIMRGEPYHRE